MTPSIALDKIRSAQVRPTSSGITLQGLGKTFSLGRKSVTALADTDLDTEKGQFLALLGPSGCGKSTILRILAGLEFPSSGLALVEGKTPDSCAASTNSALPSRTRLCCPGAASSPTSACRWKCRERRWILRSSRTW